MEKAAIKAFGSRIGWHVLRHTFASHLAMQAVPLQAIQQLLGHADIKMTLRYAHLAPSAHLDAVKKLGHYLGTDSISAAESLIQTVG